MNVITRAQWGARAPERASYQATWAQRTTFYVHYSAASKTQKVRAIQDYHMDTHGWNDIGYNWLVDSAGNIYEGQGWLSIGAHVANHNTAGIGVCFIGKDGDDTKLAREAIRWLYDEACRRAGRKLAIKGHRDSNATKCPGDKLYAWVRAGLPVDAPKPPTTGATYTVVRGDTLSGIAARYGTTVAKIAELNGIKNANLIHPGQKLKLPSTPSSHTVVRGDTLGGIAKRYGTTVDKLVKLNGIKNPNLIHPGQKLKLR
ncbi:LysM peptidoglycan-binding domain-containing protein [Micromonospora sp. NBC_01813]|uniref:LysM peptidoglycan-binding domain-containing protein n=1 Tax=Micromonospora sp. NBC_01813 TaxID=2975988 RepID=UPI002DD9CBF2|nr:LysM peptidoglycan-binding domain-containing protein [Micromonospora sp. NBC_01813]WSA11562.1 LysM peptidoglycan-binding domain-containing protein [Micromonospora sp. NBC_01813]